MRKGKEAEAEKPMMQTVVVELSDEERVRLQRFFLERLLRVRKFSTACRAMKNEGMPEGTTDEMAEALVGQWIEEKAEFKTAFDRVWRVIGRIGAIKAEEFLTDMGTGQVKTGKVSGMSQANAVASHMVLEAGDKKRWSSKVAVEKTETRNITTIVKHYGVNDAKTEFIDSPGVKVLEQGKDNGNSDEN